MLSRLELCTCRHPTTTLMRTSIDIGTVMARQTIMYQVTSPSQCSQMKFVAYCDQQNAFLYGAYLKQVANSSSVMRALC
jgi:hypothetical protein